MERVAKAVVEKLNQYPNKNLQQFVIPEKGFSSLSVEGGALCDPLRIKRLSSNCENIWTQK